MMRAVPPPAVILLLVAFLATAASASFNCKGNAKCISLVGFQPANATTYGGVASLFEVSLPSLLAANNLSTTTPSAGPVAAEYTILVSIPCRCENGTGWSNRTPIYAVQPGDGGLYNITVARFGYLTKYQDIGALNRLPNVNNITIGEKLWIPLPCSCDEVAGKEVVHLAHRVASGSSIDSIAAEFGTDNDTLLQLNGMTDPSKLQANQILDVPLHVCSSSISNKSVDFGLRLVNNSYATTAGGCITCSCSAATYQLECFESRVAENSTARCSVGTCGANLSIGDTTTSSSSSCELLKCSYGGYTNSSNLFSVMAINTTDRSNCSSSSGLSREFGLRSGFKWSALAVVFLHMISTSF